MIERWIVMSLLLMVGVSEAGTAQLSAPYATGQLCMMWSQGAPPLSGQAHQLHLKCGERPGQYTFPVQTVELPTVAANPPEYCVNVPDAIPLPTTFPATRSCVATASLGPNESKPSAELTFAVTAAGPDTVSPQVVITTPADQSIVSRQSTLEVVAVATDQSSAVTQVLIFVNQQVLCVLATSPWSCRWNVPSAANQAYTLQALAVDAAGNRDLSPIVHIHSSP